MTDRRKWEVYNMMLEKTKIYSEALNQYYTNKGYNVYCAWLAVFDEEKGLYFLDLEIGGSAEKYRHIRSNVTEEQILKMMK